MSNFKVGENVVAKDLSMIGSFYPFGIKSGEIYKINTISKCKCGRELIYLNNVGSGSLKNCGECGTIGLPTNAFYSWRFRKLDYDFAENLLAEIKEQVQSEYQLN